MSLFRYSGLTTKVYAMSGKLLTRKDFETIGQMESVTEVLTWLSRRPPYENILAKETISDLHRGTAEGLIMQSLFGDFKKLYRFSNLEQRKFLDSYFRRYEINGIKMLIRSTLVGGQRLADISEYEELFSDHASFSLKEAANAASVGELIDVLKGTPYQKVLESVHAGGSRRLFDYELALDMFSFTDQWKRVKRSLKKEDRDAVIKSVGTQTDVLNLQWIYRAKKYYRMEEADIYALLIPIPYRLRAEEIKQLVQAADETALKAAVEATKYGRYFDGEGRMDPERTGDAIQEAVHAALLRQKPYSAACLEVYLYKKEQEVHRVITAMECIRYGQSPKEVGA